MSGMNTHKISWDAGLVGLSFAGLFGLS
jgi:hypothetical protein